MTFKIVFKSTRMITTYASHCAGEAGEKASLVFRMLVSVCVVWLLLTDLVSHILGQKNDCHLNVS